MGYVPSLACGVWLGYDEKRSIGPGMTGARGALPAWTDFMMGATRGRPVEDFPMPVGTSSREVCAETGMLATIHCPSVTSEVFQDGAEPSEYCTTHPGPPLRTTPEPAPAEVDAEAHDTEALGRDARAHEAPPQVSRP